MKKVDLVFVEVVEGDGIDQFGYVAIINDKELREKYEEDADKEWLEPYIKNVSLDDIVLFIADDTERNLFYSTCETQYGYECWNGDIIKKVPGWEDRHSLE